MSVMGEPWMAPLQRALDAVASTRTALAGYRLRPALASDEAPLFALHREALRVYVERTWGWEEEWQRAHFRDHFRPDDNAVIVHQRPGQPGEDIGRVSVTRHWQTLFLRDIELLAPHRRLGLGSALLRALIGVAAHEGKRIELHVLRVNPAQQLYARLGFRVIGGDVDRLLMRCG